MNAFMEEVTMVLYIAALAVYALTYKFPNRTLSIFTLVLSVCGMSAVFQDATITDELTYIAVFPLIAVTLFAIGNICVIREGKE